MSAKLFKQGMITLLLVSFFLSGKAQEKSVAKGAEKVEQYAYSDAIKIYERIVRKGFRSVEIYKKLGDSYYFNGELAQANPWYEKMFELYNDPTYKRDMEKELLESEYYYRYSQTLKALEYYEASSRVLKVFYEKQVEDSRALKVQGNVDYLQDINSKSGRYKISNISFNSPYSDYGATVYNNQLVFTTARDTGGVSKKVHSWTGDSFTSLYAVSLDEGDLMGKAKPFARELNTKFNESTPVFTKDGKTMYFTRNNYNKGERGRDKNRTTLLKIYKAELVNGKWEQVVELPFNSDEFSTAHPALTADEKWLYFASDREEGYGQSDLYKVALLENKQYGEPINLGVEINTEGRESFPFISTDNELYFSTDGHPGLGGMDVFVTKIYKDGSFSPLLNLGTPVNSSLDDFAFYLDSRSRKGFVSSNRAHGEGKDDIYSVTELKKLTFDDDQEIVVEKAVIDKTVVEVKKEICLNDVLKLEPIYFDFDKWIIHPNAEVELAKVVEVLREYPTIKIDVRSHTDSRGNDNYNLLLSDRRAKATIDWIVQQGIDSDRLSGRGYGESSLLNSCANGVQCSEKEHQKNRRSEFIILDL